MTDIEDKLNDAIQSAVDKASQLSNDIKTNLKKAPSLVIKELKDNISLIKTKLNGISNVTENKINEILQVISDGIYYDNTEQMPTSNNMPDRSYLFIPKTHGVLDGVFYDVGDIVFYSTKKKRIYVIAAKDYVESIQVKGKKLDGDVTLVASDLGIVGSTPKQNIPYVRKDGEWKPLSEVIKFATTAEEGYARQASDSEVMNSLSKTAQKGDLKYVTSSQIYSKLKEYLTEQSNNKPLEKGVTYLITSQGFVPAPKKWDEVQASTTTEGIVKFAPDKNKSSTKEALSPQQVVEIINDENILKGMIPTPKYTTKNGTQYLNLFGRKGGKWDKLNESYNPDTFNLKKASTTDKGLVTLATEKEIEDRSSVKKAISTDVFLSYLKKTPLYKATQLKKEGNYVYTSEGWKDFKEVLATDEKKGLLRESTLTDLQSGKKEDLKFHGVTPKTLEDYFNSKLDIKQEASSGDPDKTLYSFKNGSLSKVNVKSVIDNHATNTDTGTVKLADYGQVKNLIRKVISNEPMTVDEQSKLAEMGNYVVDMGFLSSFLKDFKIADSSFIPPSNKGRYGIYNGKWIEITGTNNKTIVEKPDGSKSLNISDTVTYMKENEPPSNLIGKEGDVCFVLDSHSLAPTNLKGTPKTLSIKQWALVGKSYYLDKSNDTWRTIKKTYVKVNSAWQEVSRTQYKIN